jgi:hypothetical protein
MGIGRLLEKKDFKWKSEVVDFGDIREDFGLG